MQFHFILARKHGDPVAYPLAAAFDDAGLAALIAQYADLTKGEAYKSFAAENAELLFASVDGEVLNVRHAHQFADPAQVESRRKSEALAAAIRLRDAQSAAQMALENAAAHLEDAQSAILELTPEQEDLLAQHESALASAHAATQPRDLPTEEEQQAELDRIAAANEAQRKAAAASATSASNSLQSSVVSGSEYPASGEDGLEEITVEDIENLADEEGIDLKGATLKADLIARIRAFRAIGGTHTVEELKALATERHVDVTGAKVKADYVNAIVAAGELAALAAL